jgi:uncharacterized membrane protein
MEKLIKLIYCTNYVVVINYYNKHKKLITEYDSRKQINNNFDKMTQPF